MGCDKRVANAVREVERCIEDGLNSELVSALQSLNAAISMANGSFSLDRMTVDTVRRLMKRVTVFVNSVTPIRDRDVVELMKKIICDRTSQPA